MASCRDAASRARRPRDKYRMMRNLRGLPDQRDVGESCRMYCILLPRNHLRTLSGVPPSQSRKSKKIRRLLQEGVPASVRYLVWAHLTDSKSKRMDGLYARLGKRERVAAAPSIERDVQRCFVNHPELQDGSLANLLQAYLTMVPDIQYSRGVCSPSCPRLLITYDMQVSPRSQGVY